MLFHIVKTWKTHLRIIRHGFLNNNIEHFIEK